MQMLILRAFHRIKIQLLSVITRPIMKFFLRDLKHKLYALCDNGFHDRLWIFKWNFYGSWSVCRRLAMRSISFFVWATIEKGFSSLSIFRRTCKIVLWGGNAAFTQSSSLKNSGELCMKIINLELDDNCGGWKDMLRSFFSLLRAQIYGKSWNGEKPSLISVKIIVFFLPQLGLSWILIIGVVRPKIVKAEPIATGAGKVWMLDEKSCIHDSHNEHHVV